MSIVQQGKIYQSENGDSWWLCRVGSDVFVLHETNVPAGGTATRIEISKFLESGRNLRPTQALLDMIGEVTRCPL